MIPILMTASVSTRGMKDAYFTDQEREKMYFDALQFYINEFSSYPEQKIIFAENSGWNLDNIKNMLTGGGDRVYFLRP